MITVGTYGVAGLNAPYLRVRKVRLGLEYVNIQKVVGQSVHRFRKKKTLIANVCYTMLDIKFL